MRKLYLFISLLGFFFSSPAFSADISGNWQIERFGPQGWETFELEIEVVDNNLSISGTNSVLGDFLGEGTINGNNVVIHLHPKTPVALMDIQFDGIREGNIMKGNSKTVSGPEGMAPPAESLPNGAIPGRGDSNSGTPGDGPGRGSPPASGSSSSEFPSQTSDIPWVALKAPKK